MIAGGRTGAGGAYGSEAAVGIGAGLDAAAAGTEALAGEDLGGVAARCAGHHHSAAAAAAPRPPSPMNQPQPGPLEAAGALEAATSGMGCRGRGGGLGEGAVGLGRSTVPDEGMFSALRTAAGSVSAAERRVAAAGGTAVEPDEVSGSAVKVLSFCPPGKRGFGGISTVISGSVLGAALAELRTARFNSSANAEAL